MLSCVFNDLGTIRAQSELATNLVIVIRVIKAKYYDVSRSDVTHLT